CYSELVAKFTERLQITFSLKWQKAILDHMIFMGIK
ncbi:MAG: hypothetical protein ACI86X_002579, partial [Moritella sp.]